MLGYLVTGIAIGPFALGWIPDIEEARYLAEFGVVFLMFSIGLEFSLPRLMTMRMTVFGFGGAQVVLTIVLTALIAWLLDLPLLAASRWAASCRCRPPPSCRSCWPSGSNPDPARAPDIRALLFQDLAVVPLLILIPAFAKDADDMGWCWGWRC
jgi:monovalent cation:H+ antiporter-2, CPA2 family